MGGWIKERVKRCNADTVVARAFRKALGLPLIPGKSKAEYKCTHDSIYEDISECFFNAASPMDAL